MGSSKNKRKKKSDTDDDFEEDEEIESDEQPKKQRKVEKERKAPKKLKAEVKKKSKPKKKAKQDSSSDDDNLEEDEDEEEEEEIESDEQPKKRRKVEKERKAPKKLKVEVKKNSKPKKKAKQDSSSADEESDSDVDVKKGKRKKNLKKTKPKTKTPERAKRNRIKEVESTDDEKAEDAEDISEDEDNIKKCKAALKKEAKGKGKEEAKGEKQKAKEMVKYAEDEISHESDIDSDDDMETNEDLEQVGNILDFRTGKKGAIGKITEHFYVLEHGDPNLTLKTEETEVQYLIQWGGRAHYENTWESYKSLEKKELKTLKKVHNYMSKVGEHKRWKKFATPEDVEYQEIELQLERNLIQTHLEPERIFAEKFKGGKITGGTCYYVKWKNLPYCECTWEDQSIVESYYPTYLEEYMARKKSKSNPQNYKEALKLKKFSPMKVQPDYIGDEKLRLRDYQLDGVNFLLDAWHKGNSMILADEMGLGKTIQTITFLKYLFHNYKFKGPMLISVPLSTLAAWQKEFQMWAPEMNVIAYIGNEKSRKIIRQYECKDSKTGELTFNVLLTNYEMVGRDSNFFRKIVWSNIVIDEAHRLKNQNSLLYKCLLKFESHHRLLLTGTPLQNSLQELWCLLNYITIPDLDAWDVFEENYGSIEEKELGYLKLHTLLKPYIIRRLKKDVEKSLPGKVERILRVDMTMSQKRVYKNVLTKNFAVLKRGKNQVSLLNLMMQLRKTCNHSHLLMEPDEADIPHDEKERCQQLIYGSGKLVLLDKLLARFREKGDRVLIFSQMVTMLNIIEEFLELRRFQFQRLDGSVSADQRKQSIERFNDPTSKDFCFLLSTKAGGLGINLQTANRVIIFDSDFNPQNDLQAIARAHRIGQKEEVKIYRLVSSNSVDEDIIQRAKNKMVLDHLVIQRMDTTGKTIIGGGEVGSKKGVDDGKDLSKQDLNMILKFGAEELFKAEEDGEKEGEIDLDAILEQAEVREEADDDAHQSEANKELLGAFKCTTLAFEETEQEVEPEQEPVANWDDIIPEEMRPKKEEKEITLDDLEKLANDQRRRRKMKKKAIIETPEKGKGNSPAGSSYENSDNEASDDDDGDSDDSYDSDGSDSEQERKKALKKKKGPKKIYTKKDWMCTKCGKTYSDKMKVVLHMSEKHNEQNYVVTDENILTDDRVNEVKKKLAYKANEEKEKLNTRCFRCKKTFGRHGDYKAHINQFHNNVEPPENSDPANLALPDGRVTCLICCKKFGKNLHLRLHIKTHLGIESKTDKGKGEEEKEGKGEEEKEGKGEEEKEDQEDVVSFGQGPLDDVPMETDDVDTVPTEGNPNPDSLPQNKATKEEMVLIEKMYNSMRKYGCSHCDQRFDNIPQLKKHEKQHRQAASAVNGVQKPKFQKTITDLNAPKKPMNSYTLFALNERAKLKIEHPEYSLPEMEKELGLRWANIDPSLKQQYEQTYQEAKAIYDRENGGEKPQKKMKDPNAPKHPLNAYLFFSIEERNKIKEESSNISSSDLIKEVGRRWAELDQTLKLKFHTMAEEARQKYLIDMESYRNGTFQHPILSAAEQTEQERKKALKKKEGRIFFAKNGSSGEFPAKNGSSDVSIVQKPIKDPNAPKKPLRAYNLFAQDERAKVKIEHPEFSVFRIEGELGQRWATVDSATKQKFEALAEVARHKYILDLASYKETSASEDNKQDEISEIVVAVNNRPTIQQAASAISEPIVAQHAPEISEPVVTVTNGHSFEQAPAISDQSLGTANSNKDIITLDDSDDEKSLSGKEQEEMPADATESLKINKDKTKEKTAEDKRKEKEDKNKIKEKKAEDKIKEKEDKNKIKEKKAEDKIKEKENKDKIKEKKAEEREKVKAAKEKSSVKKDAPKKAEKDPKKAEKETPKKAEKETTKKAEKKTTKKAEKETPKKAEKETPKKAEKETTKKAEKETPKKAEKGKDTPKKAEKEKDTPKKAEKGKDTPKKAEKETPKAKKAEKEKDTPKKAGKENATPEKAEKEKDTPKKAEKEKPNASPTKKGAAAKDDKKKVLDKKAAANGKTKTAEKAKPAAKGKK